MGELLDEAMQEASRDQRGCGAAPRPKRMWWLDRLARACYLGAFATAFFCVVLGLQQARLDELEATLRPVRARLVATEVKEWIEGNDNWAPFGTFQIESGDYQGRAEGDLIPESFYAAQVQRRRFIKIPRAKAETFLAAWEIGQQYDGYIYTDAKDGIFFVPPAAGENARMVRRLGATSAVFLMLAVATSRCVAYLTRRQTSGPTNESAASANSIERSSRIQE